MIIIGGSQPGKDSMNCRWMYLVSTSDCERVVVLPRYGIFHVTCHGRLCHDILHVMTYHFVIKQHLILIEFQPLIYYECELKRYILH